MMQTQWCEWCADYGGDTIHTCEQCQHKICAASGPGMSGCIRGDTVSKQDVFKCPDCSKDGLKVSYFSQKYMKCILTCSEIVLGPSLLLWWSEEQQNHVACCRSYSVAEVDH
jgi:hypothetical protein